MKNTMINSNPNLPIAGMFNKNLNSQMNNNLNALSTEKLPEILFITTFPPRECGIATYSQDLIKALDNKFRDSFKIKICALESESEQKVYDDQVHYKLNTDKVGAFESMAQKVNDNNAIKMVLLQHEFGLFRKREPELIEFLTNIKKPSIVVFHTVLPNANDLFKAHLNSILNLVSAIIVMTKSAAKILMDEYGVEADKIEVIPHGTHLVPHVDKNILKEKYGFSGRKVLSTFGLLSAGKSIETTLNAMPKIIAENKDVLFLILGKTHPSVVTEEGEKYREMLTAKIDELKISGNVKFINSYLPLNQLLDYLQLTDIYLFTSKDPNQAVSGTFSYALSSGCPIISTPIPHAQELLNSGAGTIFDFGNSEQLATEVNKLLGDATLRFNMSSNGLHKISPTAWENSAIGHALLFEKVGYKNLKLQYKIPEINLGHFKKLTTDFGMLQFSIINKPDINSGYTIDDNARALVAMCEHYELSNDKEDLEYIKIYLNYIVYCLQDDGSFLNYVDQDGNFTDQNYIENLEDSNGRAIWALGYLISLASILPQSLIEKANLALNRSVFNVHKIHSTRAMSFIIKGVYYSDLNNQNNLHSELIKELADRLLKMYQHESDENWNWFESYLTYGNSIIPEAMLCAYLSTGNPQYKAVAKTSFDFLLSKIFKKDYIKVITNNGWFVKGDKSKIDQVGGEQPIDIAYTILALKKFANVFNDQKYLKKMSIAFNWFLGKNHLHQIVYNPCTGGCYDGLEDTYVNLNQGAESTVSYLMARLAMEKLIKKMPKQVLLDNLKVNFHGCHENVNQYS